MDGSLHTYFSPLSCFVSANPQSKKFFVFIPGLHGGYMRVGYTPELCKSLQALKIPFAQPELSSSGRGFGVSTILQDVTEISLFLLWLEQKYDAQSFVLCGHSTGCQDLVRLLSFLSGDFLGFTSRPNPYTPCLPTLSSQVKASLKKKIEGIILQAPASDRQYFRHSSNGYQKFFEMATRLIETEKTFDLLPGDALWFTPITAFRYHSLLGAETEDDTFSTDLTRTQFQKIFSGVDLPLMIAFSMKDQYVPSLYDENEATGKPVVLNMLQVWKDIVLANIQKAQRKEIVVVKCYEGATHELDAHVQEFISDVLDFVKSVNLHQ